MVMMGPATMLEPMSIWSNIVAGPIMTIHWVFPATLFPATMLPSACSIVLWSVKNIIIVHKKWKNKK